MAQQDQLDHQLEFEALPRPASASGKGPGPSSLPSSNSLESVSKTVARLRGGFSSELKNSNVPSSAAQLKQSCSGWFGPVRSHRFGMTERISSGKGPMAGPDHPPSWRPLTFGLAAGGAASLSSALTTHRRSPCGPFPCAPGLNVPVPRANSAEFRFWSGPSSVRRAERIASPDAKRALLASRMINLLFLMLGGTNLLVYIVVGWILA